MEERHIRGVPRCTRAHLITQITPKSNLPYLEPWNIKSQRLHFYKVERMHAEASLYYPEFSKGVKLPPQVVKIQGTSKLPYFADFVIKAPMDLFL